MKYLFWSILFYFMTHGFLHAQIGYVPVEDEIYNFLNRMNTIDVISDYNSFELPKSRKDITKYLIIIIEKVERLDEIDKNKLNDFIMEFELDLSSTISKSDSFIPSLDLRYILTDKEKYLYSYSNMDGSSFFVNFIGKLDYLSQSNFVLDRRANTFLYRFGGNVRGTLYNTIGFGINSVNGTFSGDKELAKSYSSLKYNYKFNQESNSELGESYFDETSAFLAYENDFSKLKIGNDRKIIGHGAEKVLLSDNAPRMDFVGLELKYKSLEFSFFHGKLLGNQSIVDDDIQGSFNTVSDKYLSYHRLGLNLSRHLNFSIGELIVYANRNIDFSYLNPFNFYKSAEHANQDRDNSILFFDFQNNSFENLKLYSTIIIDDIDFGKLGSGWFGNKTLLSIGAYSNHLYGVFPIDFELQYIKIDPYVFTHRIFDNNYTNSNYNLGSTLQPNSSSTIFSFYYRPHHRVSVKCSFSYTLHGANTLDENGQTLTNYGGDILVGHRPDDIKKIYFLDGELEIFRKYNVTASFEPIKNWILSLNLNYFNNSLAGSQQTEELFTTFSVYTNL